MTDFLKTQFIVYTVSWKSPSSGKVYPTSVAYQTFEEALDFCCEASRSKEILSIENDNEYYFKEIIHIRFNDSDDEYYITPCLFTYHKDKPLIERKDIRNDKSAEYRKLGD